PPLPRAGRLAALARPRALQRAARRRIRARAPSLAGTDRGSGEALANSNGARCPSEFGCMSFATVTPMIVVGVACFLFAWPIAIGSGFYRGVLAGMDDGRSKMIDGLRGWLALGVFFTHAACMYFY